MSNDCYIEILTFEGCPNAEVAVDRVTQALRAEGASLDVRVTLVETQEDAQNRTSLANR